MPVAEETREKAVDEILHRANLRLRTELQVQPDDPIVSLLALNEELFKAYGEVIKLAMKEMQYDISAATKLEIEAAKDTSAKMITNTAGHLKEQLLEVGKIWEKQFKETAAIEMAKIQKTAMFAYIGAGALAFAGAISLALVIGQYLAFMLKH